MQSDASIFVIDPANRTGKIRVPIAFVLPTRGSQEYLDSVAPKDLSLCLLFQKQKCNAGVKCHQIHVDRSYVDQVRQSSTGSNCCAAHGDPSSTGFETANATISLVHPDGSVRTFPLSCFARTSLLDQVLRSTHPSKRVSVGKICRLQTQGRCKYGRDCKNVHFCREIDPTREIVVPQRPVQVPVGIANRSSSATPPPHYQDDNSDSSVSETSSLCGASHQSSLRSTPAKGHSALKPHASMLPSPLMIPADDVDLSNELLLKPLKQVSPMAFCAEGFEASIRSLCEDIASIRLTPRSSTPTVAFDAI